MLGIGNRMVKNTRRMIRDFVRDNHAWLRCTECSAEHFMLHYEFTEKYPFPTINMDKTIEGIQAFRAKHALCKPIAKQLRIIDGQLQNAGKKKKNG